MGGVEGVEEKEEGRKEGRERETEIQTGTETIDIPPPIYPLWSCKLLPLVCPPFELKHSSREGQYIKIHLAFNMSGPGRCKGPGQKGEDPSRLGEELPREVRACGRLTLWAPWFLLGRSWVSFFRRWVIGFSKKDCKQLLLIQ